ALHHCGLATHPDPFSAKLIGVRITNVLKCWPPGNKPQTDELQRCGNHLRQELSMFWHAGVRQPRGVLCLGRIAHARTCAALQTLLPTDAADLPSFQHGHSQWLTPTLRLAASYHPSAQNVNTGRLNAEMLHAALAGLLASQERRLGP
ncbi:MAG: uracil-DNA glycosylase family protein, partial [Pseudomonadales bacterium]